MARTRLEMREDLLDRLNFGSHVTSDVATVRLANSFLRNAQEQLYWQYDFSDLLMRYTVPLTAGVAEYAWPTVEDNPADPLNPNPLEPRRIISAAIKQQFLWNQPLREGIVPSMYTMINQGIPTHYARRAKVELWPVPSGSLDLKIEGYCKLRPFNDDTSKTTIDEELVFMLALANAKAHYRQPDAENYAREMNSMLGRLKGADHGGRRYIPGQNDDHSAMPMPRRAPEGP